MLLGQHLAGEAPPVYGSGAASVSCIFLSPVDLPAPQKLLARLLVSGSQAVHWPGPHCILQRHSHELLIPGASRWSRELDFWQDRAFHAPIVPLGRYGKGSRLPDFSAGPLNGPKHLQDSVSSLPFPRGQLRPAPCMLLLVLTLLRAPWNPGWGGTPCSCVSFPAFTILCRGALILGVLGALLKGPILPNSPFMGSDSEAPGWGM